MSSSAPATLLRSLSVRARLISGFGGLLVLVVAIGGVAYVRLGTLREAARFATEDVASHLNAANRLVEAVNDAARAKLTLFAAGHGPLADEATRHVVEARKRINAAYAVLDTLFSDTLRVDDETRARLDSIKALRKVHAKAFDDAAARQAAGDTAQAAQMLADAVLPSLATYIGGINGLIDYEQSRAAAASKAADAAAAGGERLLVILVLLATLGGAFAAIRIGRSVTAPLVDLTSAARRLARGEVGVEIPRTGAKDEVAELAHAMAEMAAADRALANVTRQIAHGDVSGDVPVRGEQDVLGAAVVQLRGVLTELRGTTSGLANAARAGRLDQRAPAQAFDGMFRDVVSGWNDTLDALLAPVSRARDVLQRAAARDLSVRMPLTFSGDHAALAQAINAASESLDTVIREVKATSAEVSAASDQIANSSQSNANSSTEHATSLQQAASSLLETLSMARQNAGRARAASELVATVRQSTAVGVDETTRLVAAVADIRAASDRTAHIVRTIDEIAFQTNLLALNAAVEAARAGETGRGFAVVAEEVRSLALRAAEAAQQTSSLIQASVRSADAGSAISEQVQRQLRDVGERIASVEGVVSEIATASVQQEEAINQINDAVEQMNRVTQQAAADAEHGAATATELAHQSRRLDALVASFRLTQGAESPAHVPAHRPAAAPRERHASGVACGARSERAPGARPAQRTAQRPTPTSTVQSTVDDDTPDEL